MDRKNTRVKLFFYFALLWIALFYALYRSYGVYFQDTNSTISKWVGMQAGAIAIFTSACFLLEIFIEKVSEVNIKISKYFSKGGTIFFNNIFKLLFFIFLPLILYFFKVLSIKLAISIIFGAIFAYLAYWTINFIVFKTTPRIILSENNTDRHYIQKLLFNSGSAISLSIFAYAIIPLVFIFHFTKGSDGIFCFLIGALICVFYTNVSTSISKQAQKLSNDIIYDNIAQIQENDRRNPLLLLNGISKSMFEASSFSCDLFISFLILIATAMPIGDMLCGLMGQFLPLIIAGTGIFSSIIIILLTNFQKTKNISKTLFCSMLMVSLVFSASGFYLIKSWINDLAHLSFALFVGSIGGFCLIYLWTRKNTKKRKAYLNVSNATLSNSANVLFETLKEGFLSIFAPVLLLGLSIVVTFLFCYGLESPIAGLYGVSLMFLSLISTQGILLSANAFGFLGNSVDIIQDTYEEELSNKKTDNIGLIGDVGNSLMLLSKNFISFISITASLICVVAYTFIANVIEVDILNPYVICAILIGISIPYTFCGFLLSALNHVAKKLTLETKKQFKRFSQILRFEMRPDYEKCVKIASLNSFLRLNLFVFFVLIIILLVYRFLNIEALAGLGFGVILSSFGLMFLINSSSLISKGARKYFEKEYDCNKANEEYGILSRIETSFSNFQELITPSLGILIKFVAVVILIIGLISINTGN